MGVSEEVSKVPMKVTFKPGSSARFNAKLGKLLDAKIQQVVESRYGPSAEVIKVEPGMAPGHLTLTVRHGEAQSMNLDPSVLLEPWLGAQD